MLNTFRIGLKLPLVMVLIGVLALALAERIASANARATVMASGQERLRAVAESRAAEVGSRLESIRADLLGKVDNPVILEAARAFVTSWALHGPDVADALRAIYVTGNPNPPESRHRLVAAGDRSAYALVHRRYHPFFTAHLQRENYADIYLIAPSGTVVYSTGKRDLFGRNLMAGAAADSALSRAFRRTLRGPGGSAEVMSDFAADAERPGARSAILAIPVRSPIGTTEAVLALRVPTAILDAIMQRPAGLGRTGEGFLVDGRRRLVTGLRGAAPAPAATSGGGIGTPPVRAVIEGRRGVLRHDGAGGRDVVTAFVPVDFMGRRFGVMVQQDAGEILAPARAMRAQTVSDGTVALALVSILGLTLARSMSVPLTRVGEAMRRVALGDYDIAIPDRRRRDEIGMIARRLDAFRASLVEAEGVARENAFKGAAFEGTSAALMLVDRALTVIYVNEALVRLMCRHRIVFDRMVPDFRPEVLSGRSLTALFPGAERARDALGSADHAIEELRLGKTYLRVDMGPVYDADGAVLGYVVEWADVSAAHSERALLDAVERHLPVAAVSPDGRFVMASADFAAWAGRPADALLGIGWDRVVRSGGRPAGDGDALSWPAISAPSRWGQWQAAPARDAAGTPGRVLLHPVRDRDGRLQHFVVLAGAADGRDPAARASLAAGSRRAGA